MNSENEKIEYLEMFVEGLMLDPNTQAPVLILKDKVGEILLPIWIGIAEATSIDSALKKITLPRPLTHDLLNNIIQILDVKIEKVIITELKEGTYFSEIIFISDELPFRIDARPSDSIAIALRSNAKILVSSEVLKQTQALFSMRKSITSNQKSEEQNNTDIPESDSQEETEIIKIELFDFKSIDKEKWDDLLTKMDPEDFKYKI